MSLMLMATLSRTETATAPDTRADSHDCERLRRIAQTFTRSMLLSFESLTRRHQMSACITGRRGVTRASILAPRHFATSYHSILTHDRQIQTNETPNLHYRTRPVRSRFRPRIRTRLKLRLKRSPFDLLAFPFTRGQRCRHQCGCQMDCEPRELSEPRAPRARKHEAIDKQGQSADHRGANRSFAGRRPAERSRGAAGGVHPVARAAPQLSRVAQSIAG